MLQVLWHTAIGMIVCSWADSIVSPHRKLLEQKFASRSSRNRAPEFGIAKVNNTRYLPGSLSEKGSLFCFSLLFPTQKNAPEPKSLARVAPPGPAPLATQKNAPLGQKIAPCPWLGVAPDQLARGVVEHVGFMQDGPPTWVRRAWLHQAAEVHCWHGR